VPSEAGTFYDPKLGLIALDLTLETDIRKIPEKLRKANVSMLFMEEWGHANDDLK